MGRSMTRLGWIVEPQTEIHTGSSLTKPLKRWGELALGVDKFLWRGWLTKGGADLTSSYSGSSTFLQRGSPPPPPWRLLPEYDFSGETSA